jgi:hypothetical protein
MAIVVLKRMPWLGDDGLVGSAKTSWSWKVRHLSSLLRLQQAAVTTVTPIILTVLEVFLA